MSISFEHPYYFLKDNDRLVRFSEAASATVEEEAEVLSELVRYVEQRIIIELGLIPIQLPAEDIHSTTILASPEWSTATKLLLIIQNSSGSQLGVFSRSLCLEQGLSKGTWLPYIKKAIDVGFAVIVLNSNMNSKLIEVPSTNSLVSSGGSASSSLKVLIKGSETPEEHVATVWETIVNQNQAVNHIVLLGYGNGASLCKDLLIREMVNVGSFECIRIKQILTIEASSIVEEDDSPDIIDGVYRAFINFEQHPTITRRNRILIRE